ncbi:MAG: DUF262 domain-containing protein [Aestuariivirga sp.]
MDVSPDKQSIDKLFANTTYYIDFYQRDYKWSEEPVKRLLDDIFFVFDAAYPKYCSLQAGPEAASRYPWYYLNTYVTNTINGRIFVVDGQQRLTTITLILICLLRLAEQTHSKLQGWLKGKIAGQTGYESQFWMRHEKHLETLKALFDGEPSIPVGSGTTARNLKENSVAINLILRQKLQNSEKQIELHKFESFVFFFLHRLVLINLSVEQTDVPMVFEVINDRGIKLRPYEILKGKLLGQIDKAELESGRFNELWEAAATSVNDYSSEGVEQFDQFFVYYLKSKFADTRAAAQRFDNDYHREMFKPDINEKLQLDRNAAQVKAFLSDRLKYFSGLYCKMLRLSQTLTKGFERVYFNRMNEMDMQYMLVMSACLPNDPEEDEKIKLVSFNVDRLFSLLRLQKSYDSNDFTESVFRISAKIRERPPVEISAAFESEILEQLTLESEERPKSSFEYSNFANVSIKDIPKRFTRYFFWRVDDFLAYGIKTGLRQSIDDVVSKTGEKTGFHIEHILAQNEQNKALYRDEDAFNADRNRLGAVLLLKGKDNQSSNAEKYEDKLKTYANTLLWNETLREDFYKSKKDLESFEKQTGLKLCALPSFGPDQVNERQKLLFEISSRIWQIPRPCPTMP